MQQGSFMNTAGYNSGHAKLQSARPHGTSSIKTQLSKNAIKVATSNLFNLGEPPNNPDTLTDLLFEDIGGQDIINVLRTDTVNGISVKNNLISNLANINDKYGSLKIIPLSGSESDRFQAFEIDLLGYIPDIIVDLGYTSGQDNSKVTYPTGNYSSVFPANYYVDSSGNITFYFVNLNNEQIEVEFLNIDANLGATKFIS